MPSVDVSQVTACYVLSVNRPQSESGVDLGGGSVVVGPDGEILEESQNRVISVTLEHRKVVQARSA